MSYDIFDYMRRRMLREIRDTVEIIERTMREIEESMRESEEEFERVLEESLEEAERGVVTPVASLIDRGHYYLLIVDTSGARDETITVDIYQDRVVVKAELDSEKISRAFGSKAYYKTRRVMMGEYRLPVEVDVSRAVIDKKAGRIYIKLPKLTRLS